MLKLPVPAALEPVARTLESHRFPGRVLLVGGAVRDALLNRPLSADYDLVVEGDALAAAQCLHDAGLSRLPPEIFSRFGTALVRLGGVHVELASARSESYDPNSRKPLVGTATLAEDVLRRDFTVNALMMDLRTGEVLDFLGRGLDDLAAKVLRTPQDPDVQFADDPLRMMRAIRFRWRLGFDYAPGLAESIQRSAHRLKIVSRERIKDELSLILPAETAAKALEEMRQFGMLKELAPDLNRLIDCPQGPPHDADVWTHTLRVVRAIGPGRLEMTLAALLHDVAKPDCREVVGEKTTFYNHENIGAEKARAWLIEMKFGADLAREVSSLVRHHMRLTGSEKMGLPGLKRLVRDLGPQLDDLLELVEADRTGLSAAMSPAPLTELRQRLERVRIQTPAETLQSPLSGEQIMQLLNLEPGREIGEWKHRLSEAVIEGDVEAGDQNGAKDWILAHARTQNPIEAVD